MSTLPERVEYVRRSWPANPRQLSVIRHLVCEWLAPLGLDANETADLVLAVDEAVSNAIEHAYGGGEDGTVELLLWTEPETLCIEVVDHGIWKTPKAKVPSRGRGIHVMRSLADSVLIHFDERGTRVLLRRGLTRAR
ncbi:MAG: ATP-binding protein [Pseudonocardia sp.]|nr:ATP-binding protein [Pseudonocardia sp.]